jgi:subtilase family serine protease
MRRQNRAFAVPSIVVLALAASAFVASAGAAGSTPPGTAGPPQREHGRGHWFARTCAQAPEGFAACGAQVVTNASGTPLAGGSPPAGSYGPAQFHTAYNLPTTAGTAKTIAIVDAYDDPNVASDLAAYDGAYGLPDPASYPSSSPWFRKVNQNGGSTPPAANSGWGLEIALDVETAHEICQNCNILLVEASSNSFADLGTAENEAVALGASVVSNSWGGNEFLSESSYDAYFDHTGVVITASTGDSGYGVEYPASSRYVVGVGGTTLNLGSGNAYAGESAWNGAGSGCSRYETKPSWQTDTGCSRRTVADVSADADPNTGAAVYDTYGYGGWLQVGGTSLASPLVASVYALSGNTSNGAAPYSDPGALHDVTSGSNASSCSPSYLCTAGPGYDGPTGLGTPNGLAAFDGAPASPDFSLSVTPSSRTVGTSQDASYTVTMSPNSALSSSDGVAVTVGSLPSGVTASGCSTPLTTGSPSCTVTASDPATGTYTLTFTGTDAAISTTHSATATLVVAAPDFSLSISPSSQTLKTPGSVSYTITVTDLNGFSGSVSLSVSGLPSGTTYVMPGSTSSTATLTVSAATKLPRHTYTLMVTGTAGGLTHSATAKLSTR